uniref:Crp/Fnr family transcriptional regulator n=1 Tax=Toxocara canis TaxID=6265 RepID=A0A183U3C9_TOXCA
LGGSEVCGLVQKRNLFGYPLEVIASQRLILVTEKFTEFVAGPPTPSPLVII